MRAVPLLLLLATRLASAQPPRVRPRLLVPTGGQGKVLKVDVGKTPRRVEIYLPPHYDDAKRHFPVLYLQDGQNIFDPHAMHGGWAADQAVLKTTREGTAEPLIIVGIQNAGDFYKRLDEYAPDFGHVKKGPDGNPGSGGGKAEKYLDYLEHELKPWVDSRFRTRRADTAIGGSSIGALLSLHAGFTRPRTFPRVLAMSPSLWWANRAQLDRLKLQPIPPGLRLYLDSGGEDDGKQKTEELRKALTGRGMREGYWPLPDWSARLWHWAEPKHEHYEGAWRERLPRGLQALFPARQ